MRIHSKTLLVGCACALTSSLYADFQPVAVTGFSHDMVVEKTAPPGIYPVTTASLDSGTNNTGTTFYERGYNLDYPTTGIPEAGTIFSSVSFGDHRFQMAPSYKSSNAILIDTATPTATAVLTSPVATTALTFLITSGNGTVNINCTIHHADGSTEPGTILAPDWFGGGNQAFVADGRVDVNNRTFSNINGDNPRLYTVDVNLSNTTSPITSVDLARASGGGHAAIFAISTAGVPGDVYSPAPFTGYNQDLIVEIDSSYPLTTPLGVTTATMDRGIGNTNTTFYEQGYYAPLPSSGLPAPGSVIVASNATDHTFKLPDSYNALNALLIDTNNSGTLTFTTPGSYTALSFLASAGGGATTVAYTLHYTDATTQTGTIVVPDWFNGSVVAINANGRVDVNTGAFSAINSVPNNPRLYPVDLGVNQPATPIASIDLVRSTGNGHVAIFAVSATAGAVKPIFVSQPSATNVFAGSSVMLSASLSGTAPITYQWQKGTNGVYVNVPSGANYPGNTTSNFTITSTVVGDTADYVLVAGNVAGSVTSLVARVNVLTSTPNILSPNDGISLVGGSAPNGEGAASAIDGTTSKYLNFGANGGSPFVGPVGILVTPVFGSSVITGLRVFTANDATERDPVDYKIEGSNDGTTFSDIASGTLTPSTVRNNGGLTIDPLTQANQEVLFSNSTAYSSYRVTFINVRVNATANSMQIGELQLLGTTPTATGPVLTYSRQTGNGPLTITSSAPGTLQFATELVSSGNNWTTIGPINGSVTVSTSAPQTYYRVITP